ncbi:hypothetical protein, partial [uncultured Ottowia sp.]|uniref:CAP domain-containing protein n=1 Tax=uncultured Ottowia sp. TaxID=543067 RepID=UPI0025959026
MGVDHWHTPVSRRSDTDTPPAPLFGGAAGLLFTATLLARTASVPHVTLSRRNADGSVQQARISGALRQLYVQQRNLLESHDIPQPPAGQAQARLAWLPEGFLFVPRSGAAPAGRGLPVQDDGSYTIGGAMPQALLNTKAGNQYPESLHAAIDHRHARRRVEAAPLFRMPWEDVKLRAHDMDRGVGVPRPHGQWISQFDSKGLPRWHEPDAAGGKWFCHRPQVVGETAFQKNGRKLTNELRGNAGRKPLGAPLRGWAGAMGPATLYAIAASGVLGHDSRQFPQGYEDYVWRIKRRMGWHGRSGENVAWVSAAPKGDARRARLFVSQWMRSPAHYANMVKEWHEGLRYYAWVEHAWIEKAHLQHRQLPPYGLDAPTQPFSPPVSGPVATQHFFAANLWLCAGAVGRPIEADNRIALDEGDV